MYVLQVNFWPFLHDLRQRRELKFTFMSLSCKLESLWDNKEAFVFIFNTVVELNQNGQSLWSHFTHITAEAKSILIILSSSHERGLVAVITNQIIHFCHYERREWTLFRWKQVWVTLQLHSWAVLIYTTAHALSHYAYNDKSNCEDKQENSKLTL